MAQSKLEKLNDLYRNMLLFVGYEADEEGFVHVLGHPTKPTIINGARLVLPNDIQLRTPSGDKVFFHILHEEIFNHRDPVREKFLKNLNILLNIRISALAVQLLKLVASPAQHQNLSPEQARLLLIVKDADEKSAVNLSSWTNSNFNVKMDKLYINIYPLRGGKSEGRKHGKNAVVNFPFYDDLKKGVKVDKFRVKDASTYTELFEYMFPDLDTADSYTVGSSDNVAPIIESIMMAGGNVASRINELIELFKDYITDEGVAPFNLDWADAFTDMSYIKSLRAAVPKQSNNMTIEDDVPVQQTVAPSQSLQQPSQMGQVNGFNNQPPALERTSKGVSFDSILRTNPALANMVGHSYNQFANPLNARNTSPTWHNQPSYNPQNLQQPIQQGYGNYGLNQGFNNNFSTGYNQVI